MAPILIDNRSLKKITSLAVILVVLIFTAGFISGYQLAGSTSVTGENASQALSLFDQDLSDDSASAERDVTKQQSMERESENVQQTSGSENTPTAVLSPEKQMPSDSTVIAETATDYQDDVIIPDPAEKKTAPVTSAENSADFNEIKYSIQAGLYRRLDYAQKMETALIQEHLDSYVSSYVDSNNKTNFNVRFGYFRDKKSAITALKAYNKTHNSKAYLVNYSDKNIIPPAGMDESENGVVASATPDEVIDTIQPEDSLDNQLRGSKVLQGDSSAVKP